MAVGFIICIGTAGMSDLALLDFKTTLIRMIIGVVLLLGGFFMAKFGAPIYIDWD
jgi:hypothetical protein